MKRTHFLALAVAVIGTACWFAIGWQPDGTAFATSVLEDVSRHDADPASGIDVSVVGLPTFIYLGEERNFSLRMANSSPDEISCRITSDIGGAVREFTKTVQSSAETLIVLPLQVTQADLPLTASIDVHIHGDEAAVWQGGFHVVDGRGTLEGLRLEKGCFAASDGAPVILANRYEDEAAYRRWAPVKWAVRSIEQQGARRIVWMPEKLLPENGRDDGRYMEIIPYKGSPLAALRQIETVVPTEGAVCLLLGWGYEECLERLPLEDSVRTLDLAIDRIRRRNPSCQVSLLLPLPYPGEEKTFRRYAEAMRTLAREHHAPLMDLHATFAEQLDPERLFRVNGGQSLLGYWPNEAGRMAIAHALREAMP